MATITYAGGNTNRPLDLWAAASVSVTTPIVATPGGTQAAALALTAALNELTTVGTAADSVKLPLAVAGLSVQVFNTTATSAQVFGAGTDTINSVATATGVALAAGKNAIFFCTKTAPGGTWRMVLSA